MVSPVGRQALIRESPDGFEMERLGKASLRNWPPELRYERQWGKERKGGKSIVGRGNHKCKGPGVRGVVERTRLNGIVEVGAQKPRVAQGVFYVLQ